MKIELTKKELERVISLLETHCFYPATIREEEKIIIKLKKQLKEEER